MEDFITMKARMFWVVFSTLIFFQETKAYYDCYNHRSRSYFGNVSYVLREGLNEKNFTTCLNWDDSPKDWLDPNTDYPENHCRFIRNFFSAPACYVREGNRTFPVICYVFSCDAHAGCMNDRGVDYRDGAMYTENGYSCLNWNEATDQLVNPMTYPDSDLTQNFCRNPDNSTRPWCYFRDKNNKIKRDFCPIPRCRLTALHLFQRRRLTYLNMEKAPTKPAEVESAEACADFCKREDQFICRSFLYNDFHKHIKDNDTINCIWTNVSLYTLDDYWEPQRNFLFDLFTRMDNLCDFYLVDTYPELCPLPLGLETGIIKDYQINASSSIDEHHLPIYARLHGNSSWMPSPYDLQQPVISFHFKERMIISGVVMQGGGSRDKGWVEYFSVRYSYFPDNLQIYDYMNHGHYDSDFKWLRANGEPNCPKAVYFNPPIRAYSLYIVVDTYYPTKIALRMEILGCKDDDCDFTLGLTNGKSHDSQITASTSASTALYSPSHGRLQPTYGKQLSGWRPAFSSESQYLQVDFLEDMYIKAVVTQGCGDSEARVKLFTISWARQKEGKFHWIRSGNYKTTFFTNSMTPLVHILVCLQYSKQKAFLNSRKLKELAAGCMNKIFSTHTENGTLYRNDLGKPLIARKVRIYPIDWTTNICMRVEFVGCKYQVCVDRLGMESGDIADEQISQISQQIPYMEGRFARLYGPRCWMPEEWTNHQYIQIDFNGLHTISGIITQGGRAEDQTRNEPRVAWANNFRFLYRSRKQHDTWKVYKDLRGRDVEFITYPDPDTEVRHMLDRPVMTTAVRINPRGNFQNYCIRLEFIGCDVKEKGQTCEGKNTENDGYCWRTVETQESDGCEEIFMEYSHPAVIQSAKLQKFFGKEKERFQLDYIYQYVIGLQKLTSLTQTSFMWLPETANLPMTYENFRWLPESILSNNSIEMCVYLDMDDSMKWRAFPCRDIIVSRATICQIDIDECLNESDNPCSHTCVNVAGSYHCACPRGHHLTSLDGTLCLEMRLPYIPPSDYIDPIQYFEETDYTYSAPLLDEEDSVPLSEFNSTQLIFDLTKISTINTNNLSAINSAIPEDVYTKISGQQLADIRCEELWKNFSLPVMTTSKRSGIIQGLAFPRWYNTGQRCEIEITAPDGFFVTFTFHELRLRKSNSSAYCLDVLNITDHFSGEGSRLRGSYCGSHRKMVVTSRSSNVTMTLAFGQLEADMPHKLGFIATYETTNCIGNSEHCEPGCGGTDVFRDPTGSFEINSLKSNLAPFSFCNWTIHVDEDKYVALNFTEFAISKDTASGLCIDTVEIIFVDKNEVSTSRQTLCGDGKPYLLTNVSEVKIVFQTGLEAQSVGFTVNYESKDTPGCGIGTYSGNEPLDCTSPSAFIASINFPQYYVPNQNATWHIRTEMGTYVELIFHHFDVAASRDCRADHIKIYEKEYELSRFCNSNPPPSPVRSSFNTLILAFVSDYTQEASGFLAEYRTARFDNSYPSESREESNEYLCPPDWLLFDGHCYKFMTETKDYRWTDAQRQCDEDNAFLVSINGIQEMNFVHSSLTSRWFSNNTKTYIGLQLDRSLGVHVWKDNTPLSYSDWSVPTHQNNWKMRQPNGGAMEECSLIDLTNLHSTNHWHDVPCASTDTSQYICEKPAERIATRIWQEETVAKLFTGECPSSMTFINGQCITITPVMASIHDLLLQNKTCQAGLSFVKEPLASSLQFYMDHISAYQGTLPILINVVESVNRSTCLMLRMEAGHWKMRRRSCKNAFFGGAICAKPVEDQEQFCSSNLFWCSSNECIQKVHICDSTRDCADGSDEAHCPTEVEDSEFFRCGSGEKLQISFVCDHNSQCLDGSDENDCAYPVCTLDQFTCRNGQCIPIDKRCDLIPHCVDGSDESDCESSDVGFQCYDGKWIPWRAYCDGVKDCQGNSWEDEPHQCRPEQSDICGPEEIQCRSGSCEDRSTLCLYDFDQYGYQVGCRDVTHLRHCEMFECSNFTFKCPHSYCIPLHRRCDDRWDCPSGEDEAGCDNYTCPKGSYRCRGARRCLSQSFVCDGIKQCPSGDDEWLCGMECPPGCVCTGLSYKCHMITDNFITHIPSEVRRLNFSNIVRSFNNVKKRSLSESNISVYDTELLQQLHRFTLLKELDLSKSAMKSVIPFMFQSQKNLQSLFLSRNNIELLMANSFAGLVRLAKLDLSENPLTRIEPNTFLQLRRLPVLNLSGLLLDEIYPGMFTGLTAVKNLSIRNNPIRLIEEGSFIGLDKTAVLDVSDIGDGSIPKFELDVFQGLENLSVLVASNYVFCCLIGDNTKCDAPLDQFSSCKDLMRYTFLRISMWILGLSALLGNTFVLVWRWRTRQRESSKRVQTFLIINLAVADFLMGVYMITIAGADLFYRNRYMIHADEWKRSFLCQMSGLLSVLSSEASVFLLVLITIDRFLGVVFPFSVLRFHTKSVRVVVACAWGLALFLSTLPLLIVQTPGVQFYGRSSVCLALPLTSDRPQGWMYSVILFVGVNFACFTLIFVCYFIMFVAIRKASRQSTRRREVTEEVKMATKMALIVGTDLFCWMPIIIMALLSWSGAAEIPQDIYAVVAVFILPVNSAANPYLYTISTLDRSCEKTFRRGSMASPTPSSCTRDLSVNDMELVKVLRSNSIQPPTANEKHMNGIMPAIIADLSESHLLPILTFRCRNILLSRLIGRTDWHLRESDVTSIENDLKKALDMLHRGGFLHGNINEDHVVIDQITKANRTGAYLIMRGGEIETAEDTFGASEEDISSDEEQSEGSIYDNQPASIVDQEERISLIRRDWQQLKSLIQRLRTLC